MNLLSTTVVLTSHVSLFLGLAGIILEILSWNFAFVTTFHAPNKSPDFKTVALKIKIFSI